MRVLWLLRGDPRKALGGGAKDKLTARGHLGVLMARLLTEVGSRSRAVSRWSTSMQGHRLRVDAGAASGSRSVVVDELIVATGFRPDLSLLRELRIAIDPALECPPMLAPLIDPNEHSCGTVRPHGARELAQPEHGFYIAGMKSYGRAPTFLMRTGYEQIRSIVAEIDGDQQRPDVSILCCRRPACAAYLSQQQRTAAGQPRRPRQALAATVKLR